MESNLESGQQNKQVSNFNCWDDDDDFPPKKKLDITEGKAPNMFCWEQQHRFKHKFKICGKNILTIFTH